MVGFRRCGGGFCWAIWPSQAIVHVGLVLVGPKGWFPPAGLGGGPWFEFLGRSVAQATCRRAPCKRATIDGPVGNWMFRPISIDDSRLWPAVMALGTCLTLARRNNRGALVDGRSGLAVRSATRAWPRGRPAQPAGFWSWTVPWEPSASKTWLIPFDEMRMAAERSVGETSKPDLIIFRVRRSPGPPWPGVEVGKIRPTMLVRGPFQPPSAFSDRARRDTRGVAARHYRSIAAGGARGPDRSGKASLGILSPITSEI